MKSGNLEQRIKSILKNRRSLAISGGLVAAMLLLIILVIVPQFRSVLSARQKITKEQAKLSQLQVKAAELESALISPEFAQADVVNQALPSKKPLLELLNSLNQTLVASGVKLEKLELAPGLIASLSAEAAAGSKKNSGTTMELEIDVSGPFANVEQFMQLLEEIAPFTTISNFSLAESKSVVDEETGLQLAQVKASLQTKTHFFNQTVTQTLEKPLAQISVDDREVLSQLAAFQSFGLDIPNTVTGGGQEDLFGVAGYAEELRRLYQSVDASQDNF